MNKRMTTAIQQIRKLIPADEDAYNLLALYGATPPEIIVQIRQFYLVDTTSFPKEIDGIIIKVEDERPAQAL